MMPTLANVQGPGAEACALITVEHLFGPWMHHPDATIVRQENAARLLVSVNRLLAGAANDGVALLFNPKTGTRVSGEGLGGFRPQDCATGAPNSAHKQGRAIDIFDPRGLIDAWLTDAKLERLGLYREHPAATRGWCHLTDRAPASGQRSFMP